MSVPRRTTLAGRLLRPVVAAAAALVIGGPTVACSGPTTPSAEPDERPTSTALSAYDADGPSLVARSPCAGIDALAVADALGEDELAEDDVTTLTWAPGRRLPGTSEVADEHGCRHVAGDRTASAWVFAAPTSRAQAERLVREATGGTCRRLGDADTFGEPGVAFTCALDAGTSLTGMRGLVGATWVSCEIRGTDDVDRVGRWCAAVLTSLSTP